MGALMVADPQPTARYQPTKLYINRGAPKNRGWLERERKQTQNKTYTNKPKRLLSFLVKTQTRSEPFLHQYRPKITKTETDRERVERL